MKNQRELIQFVCMFVLGHTGFSSLGEGTLNSIYIYIYIYKYISIYRERDREREILQDTYIYIYIYIYIYYDLSKNRYSNFYWCIHDKLGILISCYYSFMIVYLKMLMCYFFPFHR